MKSHWFCWHKWILIGKGKIQWDTGEIGNTVTLQCYNCGWVREVKL